MSTVRMNRSKRLTILLFVGLFSAVAIAEVGPNWIEQWGIRWTFDKPVSQNGTPGTYQYGTFINGDYWVLIPEEGSVGVAGISPATEVIDGRTINGSMLNPIAGQQGFDSAADIYHAEYNWAIGISSESPKYISSPSSLISTIHRDTWTSAYPTRLQTAAVLTFLSSVPDDESFRPAYCGSDKTIVATKLDINETPLKALILPASAPTWESREQAFERVWIDHINASNNRGIQPYDNMPRYGVYMAQEAGLAVLMLNSDASSQTKRKTLVGLLQRGIDLWGTYKTMTGVQKDNWRMDGGQGAGRKLPILFAGTILGIESMANIGSHAMGDPWFGEDQITIYLSDYGISWDTGGDSIRLLYPITDPEDSDYNNPDWPVKWDFGDGPVNAKYFGVGSNANLNRNNPSAYYTDADRTYVNPNGRIGIPEYAKTFPENARWICADFGATYRITVQSVLPVQVLAVHIMGLKQAWNHDALFDYTDRHIPWAIENGHDPFGSNFIKEMWNLYRANYGYVWQETANNNSVQYALTTEFDVEQGTVTPNSGQYNSNDNVQIVANAKEGYHFLHWEGDVSGSINQITITMDDDKTVTAIFIANTYTLNITTANGSVTKSPNKTTYTHGETVTLTATANAGYTFGSWVGDTTGMVNPVTITMDSNKAVTANFTQNAYTLNITAANGTVTKSPDKAAYTYGETVTLTATANTGYTFDSWSGSATGTANPVTITMDGNKSVTANYTPNNSPVAHWLFDEPYQSTAVDIISGQTASLINDPNWGEAWAREHLIRLDTGSQAMQIPMSTCRPESGSIALRIQPENTDSIQILFGHALDSIDNRIALYLAAGNLALGIGDTLQNNICRLTTNQSYHVAVTWDGTDYAVFVDGDPKISGVFNGLSRLDATADVGNYGTPENRTSGIGFRGLVEDVQLYPTALTAEAIQTLSLTHYVRENRPLEFIVSGVDQQGNPINYAIQNLPHGATFDVASQTFSWQPALYRSAGQYQITFTAVGQSDHIVTVSVLDAAPAGWYSSFLESVGKD